VLSAESIRSSCGLTSLVSAEARVEVPHDTVLHVDLSADLAAVGPAWRHLERTGVCSPYQRFDWIGSYAATMSAREAESICVLSVRRGGEPLLLLPLAVRVRHGVRIAAPVGGKQANYHGPLMARGAGAILSPPVMRSLLRDAAARARIDVFALQDLHLAWRGERNPLVLPGATPSPSNAPSAALPPDADALLGRIGTSESRRKLRRKEAGLAALGEFAYCLARSRDEVYGILEAFFRQKNERLRELGIASPFDDDAARRFVRAACLAGLDEGRPAVELHGLSLDGRFIATCGGAIDGQRFSCMFNSFDQSPEIARFSPGDILLTRIIRTQCEFGRTEIDLGIGEARYKQLFCKDVEELVDVFLPVTLRGRLYGLVLRRLAAAKRAVKQTPRLWSLAQTLRAGRARLGFA
jgi:CelD/BcsL family acetyltransferase involved in cellulose biosynthesis